MYRLKVGTANLMLARCCTGRIDITFRDDRTWTRSESVRPVLLRCVPLGRPVRVLVTEAGVHKAELQWQCLMNKVEALHCDLPKGISDEAKSTICYFRAG
jgi:hypothetical protein